jgi:hypothetical protein
LKLVTEWLLDEAIAGRNAAKPAASARRGRLHQLRGRADLLTQGQTEVGAGASYIILCAAGRIGRGDDWR